MILDRWNTHTMVSFTSGFEICAARANNTQQSYKWDSYLSCERERRYAQNAQT